MREADRPIRSETKSLTLCLLPTISMLKYCWLVDTVLWVPLGYCYWNPDKILIDLSF